MIAEADSKRKVYSSKNKRSAASTASRLKILTVEEKLLTLGLRRPIDFAFHFPLRFEDHTRITPIALIKADHWAQVCGKVLSVERLMRRLRGRSSMQASLQARLRDESGAQLTLQFLHPYPGLEQRLQVGTWLRVAGEVQHRSKTGFEMVHPKLFDLPSVSPVSLNALLAADVLPTLLTPVYSTTERLSQTVLKRRIAKVLNAETLNETLPAALIKRYSLMDFADSIHLLHQPPPSILKEEAVCGEHPAWQRIKFDEALAQQLALMRARQFRLRLEAPALIDKEGPFSTGLMATLPFALTAAQHRALAEIRHDLSQAKAMQRLLQGDVGCGKTIVAALAAAQVLDHGYQVAFMAPTEILAQQHFQKLNAWFKPLGMPIAILSADMPPSQRRDVLAKLADHTLSFVVGTHALIQNGVNFKCLGLAIVDEQHRFGVSQRLDLKHKTEGMTAHQLMMSATPIPRSLAMTYMSDLDVTVIDELPPGRLPVLTKLIDHLRRESIIEAIGRSIAQGRQCYWVCPLIEENEDLALSAAQVTYVELQARLPNNRVGLLHGRLSAAEKAGIMQDFSEGKIALLVATTVIEVGVDVPNASVLVIEHAERFGLAQLHQLRGRVGRGTTESFCLLLYEIPLSFAAKSRLRAMKETQDGFEIARRDLHIRGPGEFLGTRQSGLALLRFADIEKDAEIIAQARAAANWMLQDYPDHVIAHLARWLPDHERLLGA